MNEEQKQKVRETIALLNSMVIGGEEHSEQSKAAVAESLAMLSN